MTRIVGLCLVKNEDIYIRQVISNILDFCDEIIVADNMSDDSTYKQVKEISRLFPKVSLIKLEDYTKSQDLIKGYAGTDTWIFGVDGDEVYDPNGLYEMRKKLLAGEFNKYTHIYGNVLNCSEINKDTMTAKGYLSPPSRSMTKLYNYSVLKDASDRAQERLHGKVIYKEGYNNQMSLNLHNDTSWEDAKFRCLHLCFMVRSTKDRSKPFLQGSGRVNISEKGKTSILAALKKGSLTEIKQAVLMRLGLNDGSGWKMDKYMRGQLVEKNVELFFRSYN